MNVTNNSNDANNNNQTTETVEMGDKSVIDFDNNVWEILFHGQTSLQVIMLSIVLHLTSTSDVPVFGVIIFCFYYVTIDIITITSTWKLSADIDCCKNFAQKKRNIGDKNSNCTEHLSITTNLKNTFHQNTIHGHR